MIKRFFQYLKDAFLTFVVVLDESKRINEDGSWNKYNERKNRKAMKKAQK